MPVRKKLGLWLNRTGLHPHMPRSAENRMSQRIQSPKKPKTLNPFRMARSQAAHVLLDRGVAKGPLEAG